VKNRRVYKIPLVGYRWDPPSAEWPLMWRWAAQKQHPELFNYYSMLDKLRRFCHTFYNYQLSEERAKKLLRMD